MKRYAFFALFVASFLFYIPSGAIAHVTDKGHVHSAPFTVQNFLNTDCQKNDTCGLKRFMLMTRDYEVHFAEDPEPSRGTETIMEYETDLVSSIENYTVVNFLRGCMFDSSKDEKGEVTKILGYVKEQFGDMKIFCFPEWVIDSVDEDPAYNSDPELGRHYLLRWNEDPKSYNFTNKKFYGMEKPKKPIVYMSDLPGSAFRASASVSNTSLDFKTCIYRSKDVPKNTVETDINFAEPIKCFEWKMSYIYNFESQKYERKDTLDPFCTDKSALMMRKEEPFL